MLCVTRFPIIDLRPLLVDPAALRDRRLPETWTPPDFVRGFGAVQPRRLGALAEWESEATFVNATSLRFQERTIERLNSKLSGHIRGADYELSGSGGVRRVSPLHCQSLMKRLWRGGVGAGSLFDLDVTVPTRATNPYRYVPPEIWIVSIRRLIDHLLAEQVSFDSQGDTLPLRFAGPMIAGHFARSTAANLEMQTLTKLVRSSPKLPLVVVDSEYSINDNAADFMFHEARDEKLSIFGADLGSPVLILAKKNFRDSHDSAALRRRVRVSLLRIHSSCEFLKALIWAVKSTSFTLAAEQDDSLAYRRISSTLRQIVQSVEASMMDETMRRAVDVYVRITGNHIENLLHDAFETLNIEQSTIAEDWQFARITEGRRVNAVTINQNIKFGKNATVHTIVQTATAAETISVGTVELNAPQLIEELTQLLRAAGISEDPEATEALNELMCAVDEATVGNPEGLRHHLKKAGKWALRMAEQIGAGLASQALATAIYM